MPIAEALVASVVAETSERMKDPQYVQLSLGEFVQSQRPLSQYLSSRAPKLGGAEALVTIVFHAQILCECLRRGLKIEVPAVDFPSTAPRATTRPSASRSVSRRCRATWCRMWRSLRCAWSCRRSAWRWHWPAWPAP